MRAGLVPVVLGAWLAAGCGAEATYQTPVARAASGLSRLRNLGADAYRPPTTEASRVAGHAARKPPRAPCGNGRVDRGEACDDGNTDSTDGCIGCALATCGDGYVQAGVEECDDGAANSNCTADACRHDCRPAHCGDGTVDTGEVCDGAIGCLADCSGWDGTEQGQCGLGPCGGSSTICVEPGEELPPITL